MDISEKLKKKLRQLPDAPGCYMMRNRAGTIIYVGKAASLRKRVRSYFRDAAVRSGSPKLRGMVKSVEDIDCLVVRNEAEAVLTEGRLIKEYKPRYNVSFRDDKRFLLLRADPRVPFPRFELARIRRRDGAAYFGPYASAAAARATQDFVDKHFGLRKCAPRLPDAETYRHCLNDIIAYCSAPCIGSVSPEEYHARFEEACAFLRGERPRVLAELREKMDTAANAQEFERAAALRDTWLHLRRTVEQRARVAATPEMRKNDAADGVKELRRVLGLAVEPRLIEGFDISNVSGTYSVASLVCVVDGLPHRKRYRRFRIRTVEGSDDPGMMAEAVERRIRQIGEEGSTRPDLIVVDGGITQLRAARKALANAGAEDIPVIGLAKRFEEIYWQDSGKPLRLPRDSRALKVLQRLRDEAHRFALTYHRYLRHQRIRESVLDGVPGIGDKRKQQILQHFGSVRRLAKASPDDIAEVPGIGPELAETIAAALGRHKA